MARGLHYGGQENITLSDVLESQLGAIHDSADPFLSLSFFLSSPPSLFIITATSGNLRFQPLEVPFPCVKLSPQGNPVSSV
jgi:hypothetical protein